MPHLTLEYSSNLNEEINYQELFHQLHQVLNEVGNISLGNFKSRAIRREQFVVGHGNIEDAFVHLEMRLLEGKSATLKEVLGQECMLILKEYFKVQLTEFALQITVDIVDMPRDNYFKFPEGTL